MASEGRSDGRDDSARAPGGTAEQPSSDTPPPALIEETLVTIVGVGASAGGLEAFRELIEALPAEPGMALVYVQHLDPEHESLLSELLGHASRMPVQQVKDSMPVQVNHVYVAPPGADVRVRDGHIVASPMDRSRGRHNSIDTFFRSMAAARGARAVGVIMSGTASDGVLGLRAIKGEGGITFVQSVETARFAGMPRAAIAAGVADFVLPPREIARELMRIGEHPLKVLSPALQAEDEPPPAGDQDAMHRILSLVWKRSYVDFSYYKPSTLRRRILRRMVLSQMENLEEYAQLLERNPAEVKSLYEDLVINVTSFFRDPEVFEALKRDVFPRILQTKSGDMPIRLWVPGCSTGEEVYSLAITLLEYLGEKASVTTIQIFGTDISENAIERARAGVYPKEIETDVQAERLHRFFVEREDGYQIAKAVRDLCVFARQNVFKDPPFSNLDLISCRNVLIYFGPDLQKRVLPLFYYALRSSGHLILGNSESVGSFADYFVPSHSTFRIYSKRNVPGQPFAPITGDYAYHPTPPRQLPEIGRSFDPQREADRVLLERYGPPSVLIDRDMNILQFRGRTGPYLEPAPGAASFNLLRMAREGLMVAIHTAVHEALASEAPVRKDGVSFKSNGDFHAVNLRVLPLINPAPGKEKFLLVLFESAAAATRDPTADAAAPAPVAAVECGDVQRMREELIATKEYLQSVIESQETFNEELRSANEEILSSNEELQSTNEELEAAKEELQSANEELTSLNEELQTRNNELAKVNADLSNLLNSINIAIVMLDDGLRIRRFTPPAERLLNLIHTDIGRPFNQINPAIAVPGLESHVQSVITTLEVRDLEVQDREGRWYSLRIKPYKTADNRIDGVVLSLSDIEAEKQSRARAQNKLAFAEALSDMVREPLLTLSRGLRVMKANQAFCDFFGMPAQEVEEHSVLALGSGAWGRTSLRAMLEEIASGKRQVAEIDTELGIGDSEHQPLTVRARLLPTDTPEGSIILLAIAPRT